MDIRVAYCQSNTCSSHCLISYILMFTLFEPVIFKQQSPLLSAYLRKWHSEYMLSSHAIIDLQSYHTRCLLQIFDNTISRDQEPAFDWLALNNDHEPLLNFWVTFIKKPKFWQPSSSEQSMSNSFIYPLITKIRWLK